ncbi:VanW family protein [Leptospira neocaledonica]|uniref:Vancomycin resistance protein n=1 Tax=Leptospira neocaledonica TaxID=2023192 RepID=A0A2M9ZV02_9LEPT|nr:VanW family protein [Leptospira neocaledonica]PJZ75897.1 vancomycin resistance protein [Leptospira neocaledonica]
MSSDPFDFKKRVVRSSFRMFFGTLYFRIKRRILWILQRSNFAKNKSLEDYPYKIFEHKSPLLRKLKDVEMILQYNKIKNLEIASLCLNGLIIEPGKVFSFWRLVGKPTASRGFLPGMQLRNGGFLAKTGGGLCQMTNLIYWMTLHSPLTVVERWRHSFDVFPDSNRTLPFGSGATCAYNYIDLQIRNDTKAEYQLKVWLEGDFLKGEWRTNLPGPFSYTVYESKHQFRTEPWGGYTRRNEIRRKIFENETLVEDEFITENIAWVMYNPILPK